MYTDAFKIYIDRLSQGKVHKIKDVFPSDFIGINESELKFEKPVGITGEAYIAEGEGELVLHLSVKTEALVPCSICNEMSPVEIVLDNLYEVIPLEDIKGAIFDFSQVVREEIILKLPTAHECSGGKCPKRKEYTKYFKTEASDIEEGYHPFADL